MKTYYMYCGNTRKEHAHMQSVLVKCFKILSQSVSIHFSFSEETDAYAGLQLLSLWVALLGKNCSRLLPVVYCFTDYLNDPNIQHEPCKNVLNKWQKNVHSDIKFRQIFKSFWEFSNNSIYHICYIKWFDKAGWKFLGTLLLEGWLLS